MLFLLRDAIMTAHGRHLIHIDAELSQVDLGQADLLHELLVSGGHVVEGENAETEAEEQD